MFTVAGLFPLKPVMLLMPCHMLLGLLLLNCSSTLFIYFIFYIIFQRELNICVRSEARVCALMSARTNLLTARASSRPLALKCLNWQSIHGFSLNTDINVCSSGLTCAHTLSAPG